jgi:hypothetical protein
LIAGDPVQAPGDGRFRFGGAAAVARLIFTRLGAGAAIHAARTPRTAVGLAADIDMRRPVAVRTKDRAAAAADLAQAGAGGQRHGRAFFVPLAADDLGRVGFAEGRDLALARRVVVKVDVRLVGKRIDLIGEKSLPRRLLRRLRIDDQFACRRFGRRLGLRWAAEQEQQPEQDQVERAADQRRGQEP